LSSDDEECLTTHNVAEMTAARSNHAACLLTAARLDLHLPSELPNNWAQIQANFNDYH
jgi:hypothetical protein